MALTGVQTYKFLPKTNCKECGFSTCLSFAMKLAQSETELSACPHVSDETKQDMEAASNADAVTTATEAASWRYGMNDIWGFNDLSPMEKDYAEEQGCESGKKYYGDPLSDHDVAQCPFCNQVIWLDSYCPHLIFRYLHGSGMYMYINERFEQYFWNILIPSIKDDLGGYLADTIEENSTLRDLLPSDILDFIDDAQYYESDSFSGDTSEVCGFITPDMLLKII
jgi:hypothetical protein